MSLSEVFRPSTGALYVRDNIANGQPVSRSYSEPARPATQGGYRFGQLSRSQFFTRHNPHPNRVRHFKGLLDVPICSVNDEGHFATPKYSLNFPPNSYNLSKLNQYNGRIPVNSLNIDAKRHQTNTVSGLDYFTGLNSYPFREKAVPTVGLEYPEYLIPIRVPVTESWRQQLKAFTDQLNTEDVLKPKKEEQQRPRTTMYSSDTGRLIPPPSRAMSRHASRRGPKTPFGGPLQHIAADPDIENMVLNMLCQILQTEDSNAVQQWLCSASEREKTIVMDLIRAAMAGKDEYHNVGQQPVNILEDNKLDNFLPPINENIENRSQSKIDRLIVNEDEQTKQWLPTKLEKVDEQIMSKPSKPITTDTDDFNGVQPPSTEVFRPSTQGAQKRFEPLDDQLPTADMMETEFHTTVPTATWNPQQSVNTF